MHKLRCGRFGRSLHIRQQGWIGPGLINEGWRVAWQRSRGSRRPRPRHHLDPTGLPCCARRGALLLLNAPQRRLEHRIRLHARLFRRIARLVRLLARTEGRDDLRIRLVESAERAVLPLRRGSRSRDLRVIERWRRQTSMMAQPRGRRFETRRRYSSPKAVSPV